MCFCCQSYSSDTGSGAAIIDPDSPPYKGRGFLQDTVLKWTFTWVPHKQETKDAVKRDREIRGNTQLGLIWDLETDLSITKKVRGSTLGNNGKWNTLSAWAADSYIQRNCLGNYTTNWAVVASSQGASQPDQKINKKKGRGNPDKQNVHYSCGLSVTRLTWFFFLKKSDNSAIGCVWRLNTYQINCRTSACCELLQHSPQFTRKITNYFDSLSYALKHFPNIKKTKGSKFSGRLWRKSQTHVLHLLVSNSCYSDSGF